MFNFIRGRSRVHFQANSISVQPNANFNPQSILLTTIPPESSMEPPNPTDGSRPWISISPGWWRIHGRHFFLPSWVPCANNANAWVVGRKEVIILNRVFAILLWVWSVDLGPLFNFKYGSLRSQSKRTQHTTNLFPVLPQSQLRSYKFKLRTVPVNRSSINVFPQLHFPSWCSTFPSMWREW